jgi:hypothetical protein
LKYTIKNLIMMPNLNHTGPEGNGTKTGRKLGKCKKSLEKQGQVSQPGKRLGMLRNSGGGVGKGKRLKTFKNIK